MPRQRQAKIAFGEVSGIRGTDGIAERALVPGTAIVRYSRLWRLGQWRWLEPGRRISGRIGYERPGEIAELWDPRRNDFVETQLPEGMTSPFLLDVQDGRIAFQLRAGRIKAQSFSGALRALLNEADPNGFWRVEHLAAGEPWSEWQARARRIQKLEIRVERPNPHYGGRDDIEAFVEDHRARVVKLILEAYETDPQGLTLDEFIEEAIEQSLYRGNLTATADFQTEFGPERRVWRKDVEGSPIETKVPADPETGEASPEALADELDHERADELGIRPGEYAVDDDALEEEEHA